MRGRVFNSGYKTHQSFIANNGMEIEKKWNGMEIEKNNANIKLH